MNVTASPRPCFSTSVVAKVVRSLQGGTKGSTERNWLQAVASRVSEARPDLAINFQSILGERPGVGNPLSGLSIGEIGVCYEALMAHMDIHSRKSSGQFFTPDDAAQFMASFSHEFPTGTWIDPCCGVGTLSWYLVEQQADPGLFVRNHLILADWDEIVLRSAVCLVGAEFLDPGDVEGLNLLYDRSLCRDFLNTRQLPDFDFAIFNPPYARTKINANFITGHARDMFSFFLEKVALNALGFISVTPASYLYAPKYFELRRILDSIFRGGQVFVFDNVPDTLFRGFKFGSTNTSNTNFVRAAITVCPPEKEGWEITPILRWRASSRSAMFKYAPKFLNGRRLGPHGEWVKLSAEFDDVWAMLREVRLSLGDVRSKGPTPYHLTVATTPRYYISAAYRDLARASKSTLFFESADIRDRAAMVLNSSLPYLWWRALDGGVTLPQRVLNSIPLPDVSLDTPLVAELKKSENSSVVRKLNAGKYNENVKRPLSLTRALDEYIFGRSLVDGSLYQQDMFSSF